MHFIQGTGLIINIMPYNIALIYIGEYVYLNFCPRHIIHIQAQPQELRLLYVLLCYNRFQDGSSRMSVYRFSRCQRARRRQHDCNFLRRILQQSALAYPVYRLVILSSATVWRRIRAYCKVYLSHICPAQFVLPKLRGLECFRYGNCFIDCICG